MKFYFLFTFFSHRPWNSSILLILDFFSFFFLFYERKNRIGSYYLLSLKPPRSPITLHLQINLYVTGQYTQSVPLVISFFFAAPHYFDFKLTWLNMGIGHWIWTCICAYHVLIGIVLLIDQCNFLACTNLLMSLNVVNMAGCSVSVKLEHFLKILWQFFPSWPSRAARIYLKNRNISTLSDVGFRNSFNSLLSVVCCSALKRKRRKKNENILIFEYFRSTNSNQK